MSTSVAISLHQYPGKALVQPGRVECGNTSMAHKHDTDVSVLFCHSVYYLQALHILGLLCECI